MVDYKGLSERTGLKVQTLRQYKSMGRLPKPDGYVMRSPVWAEETVARFAREFQADNA